MKYTHALLGAFASTITAHTWIEQLMVIAPNGTLIGEPGYPRGNVKRGTPGFGDPAMVNLIPGNDRPINQILPADLMCKSTQTTQSQTNDSPRLQAAAGDNVALRYQENGHVSLPQNQPGKPDNRGTIYVYGTTQPKETDAFLSIHRVWNAEGTGGDGRGVLLSTQNYDDGQCYQVNGGQISVTRQKTFSHVANSLMGADLWCQQDVQIPATAPSGKPYTLYWVWDWPTMPGTEGFPNGKQEIYTTCMDVDVVANGGQSGNVGSQNKALGNSFVKGQDVANAAVASQLADIANPTAVTGQFIPFLNADTSGGSSNPTGVSGKTKSSSAPSPLSTSESIITPPRVGPTNAPTAPYANSSYSASQTDTYLQASGSTNVPTAIGTAPAGSATISAMSQPSNSDQQPPFTRTHRPRPSVSPIGPPNPDHNNGNPYHGPDGTNNNGNGPPTVNPFSSPSPPVPSETASATGDNNSNANTNTNLNTGTAISNALASTTASPTTITTTTVPVGAASVVTKINSIFETVTQTKVETIYLSATPPAITSSVGNNQRRSAAEELSSTSTSTRVAACSQTESVYRLRARRPFYILPKIGNLTPEQTSGELGAGC